MSVNLQRRLPRAADAHLAAVGLTTSNPGRSGVTMNAVTLSLVLPFSVTGVLAITVMMPAERGVGGELLLAVEDPVRAVVAEARGGLHVGGVGADFRLAQAERGELLAARPGPAGTAASAARCP